MCWSAEVAATFFGLQFCSFVYLLYRNQHYDRWYTVALTPVMMQEFSQMMLWLNEGGFALLIRPRLGELDHSREVVIGRM